MKDHPLVAINYRCVAPKYQGKKLKNTKMHHETTFLEIGSDIKKRRQYIIDLRIVYGLSLEEFIAILRKVPFQKTVKDKLKNIFYYLCYGGNPMNITEDMVK